MHLPCTPPDIRERGHGGPPATGVSLPMRSVRYAVVALRGVWRSLVARFVRDEEGVGSNPGTPTAVTQMKALIWRTGAGLSQYRDRPGELADLRQDVGAQAVVVVPVRLRVQGDGPNPSPPQ